MKEMQFRKTLEEYGQVAFLDIFDNLAEAEKSNILKQADLLDLSMLYGASREEIEKTRGVISPIRTLKMAEYSKDAEEYRQIGLKAIGDGKVGALMLAGGMGTRLGCNHAKGMVDIGITHTLYIFECQIRNMLKVTEEAGCFFHLFIMLSYLNEGEVKEFFREHDYFGYDPAYIHFYSQDMSPCLDKDYGMFLEKRNTLAMSPNGNGGFYSSLVNAGMMNIITGSGIEYLNVFAVDNVLQKIADPVFVGALIKSECATGAKVVRKAAPDEKVGAICLEDGTPSVVEYFEMTEELMNACLEDGSPAYEFGVILNYIFRVRDMNSIVNTQLPVHLVHKKAAYLGCPDGAMYTVDDIRNGAELVTIDPSSPNAYKLETLSLDFVHLTDSCLSFEVEREKEFAPIKNATGVDSVETARELLRKNGVKL